MFSWLEAVMHLMELWVEGANLIGFNQNQYKQMKNQLKYH